MFYKIDPIRITSVVTWFPLNAVLNKEYLTIGILSSTILSTQWLYLYLLLGSSGDDEMCNLYLMFYSLSKTDDFKLCFDEQNPRLSRMLPDGNVFTIFWKHRTELIFFNNSIFPVKRCFWSNPFWYGPGFWVRSVLNHSGYGFSS